MVFFSNLIFDKPGIFLLLQLFHNGLHLFLPLCVVKGQFFQLSRSGLQGHRPRGSRVGGHREAGLRPLRRHRGRRGAAPRQRHRRHSPGTLTQQGRRRWRPRMDHRADELRPADGARALHAGRRGPLPRQDARDRSAHPDSARDRGTKALTRLPCPGRA